MRVSGVPPDYFSVTGQRWGNPFIVGTCWSSEDSTGGWRAFGRALALFRHGSTRSFSRLRGLLGDSSDEETAVRGTWVKTPGHAVICNAGTGTGRPAVDCRRPGRDYAGGGGTAPAISPARHAGAAIWFRGSRRCTCICRICTRRTRWSSPVRTTTTPRWAGGRRHPKWSNRP